MEFFMFLWQHCHPGVIVCYLCLARRYKFLFHIYFLSLAGAVSSRMVPYPFVAVVRTVTICHKGDTLRPLGQGTTSGLRYTRKGSVGEAPRCCFG